MLGLKPNQSLMIGSMPQVSLEETFTLLDKYPLSIPTWPQLPKRSFKEAMVPQYVEGFPGICVDEENKKVWLQRDEDLIERMTEFYENVVSENREAFAISSGFAAGLHHFLARYSSGSAKLPLVKGQITGPFTFGLGLNDNEGRAVWFDDQYRDVVLKGIMNKTLWLVGEMKKVAQQVILFFDEPILSALGTPAYISIQDEDVIRSLNEVIETVHASGAYAGVHCCGNMDWGLLAKTDVDIISFDAYFYGDKLALYPEEIKTFLERGGYLAWGIVPTLEVEKIKVETPETLKSIHEKLINSFVDKGLTEESIRNQALFTPSCGMGTLPGEYSVVVLDLLSNII